MAGNGATLTLETLQPCSVQVGTEGASWGQGACQPRRSAGMSARAFNKRVLPPIIPLHRLPLLLQVPHMHPNANEITYILEGAKREGGQLWRGLTGACRAGRSNPLALARHPLACPCDASSLSFLGPPFDRRRGGPQHRRL